MPIRRKYTDEQLREAVRVSGSWREVNDRLGLKYKTGSNEILKSVRYNIQRLGLSTAHFVNDIKPRSVSEETKQKISRLKKEWIRNNPSKHNWSVYGKAENKPERLFREALLSLGISAVQYYIPRENERLFEIDFAIPQSKIAFEINGNQHYSNGKLAEYYQDRHDYLVSKGWVVNEIHYSECFNKDKIIKIINEAVDGINISYSSTPEIINYRQKIKDEKKAIKEKDNYIKECNDILIEDLKKIINLNVALDYLVNLNMVEDSHANRKEIKYPGKQGGWNKNQVFLEKRKVDRPSKEELEKLIWEKPTVQIAKDFNVSDKAVEKWCKAYGISKPPKGYWAKHYASKSCGIKQCSFCSCDFECLVGTHKSSLYCSDKCSNAANWNRKKIKKSKEQ
jgi:very-short-patch-repair endonuclease